MADEFNRKIKETEASAEQLLLLYDGAEKPEELQLAYIVRGQRNILNRIKVLVEAARKEITVLVSNPWLLKEIQAFMMKAKNVASK